MRTKQEIIAAIDSPNYFTKLDTNRAMLEVLLDIRDKLYNQPAAPVTIKEVTKPNPAQYIPDKTLKKKIG